MAEHYVVKCRVCDRVCAQCRCPSESKVVYYVTCEECGGAGEEEPWVTSEVFSKILSNFIERGSVAESIDETVVDWDNEQVASFIKEYREKLIDIRDKIEAITKITEANLDEDEQEIDEAQAQGVGERVARRTRMPKVTPTSRNMDQTPRKPANNDPTKTPRGKVAVKRRGEKNKKDSDKFREQACSDACESLLKCDDDEQVAVAAESLQNPIAVCRELREIGDERATRIESIVRNVRSTTPSEQVVSGLIRPTVKDELGAFDKSIAALNEAIEWGYKFGWIERIPLKGGIISYKVCADNTPSELYMERKQMKDRDVLRPRDRSNIIQIAMESSNGFK